MLLWYLIVPAAIAYLPSLEELELMHAANIWARHSLVPKPSSCLTVQEADQSKNASHRPLIPLIPCYRSTSRALSKLGRSAWGYEIPPVEMRQGSPLATAEIR